MIENVLDNASCKLKDTHPNLHRWKSWQPNTPFAPIFDLPLWMEDLNPWFIEDLCQLIVDRDEGNIDNEVVDNVVKPYGLNYEKRWKNYNIFNWEDKSIQFLRASIWRVYNDYMESLGLSIEENLWIRGWAVRMNKGEYLSLHSHSFHENTYLSGNLMVSNHKTTTDYAIPHLSTYYGFYKVENKPARITLFPSWVQHKVDSIDENDRISIGFDLFTFDTMEYISKQRQENPKFRDPIMHSIPLVKPE